MTLVAIFLLVLLVGIVAGIMRLRLHKKWQADPRAAVETRPQDWALIFSPPCTALVVLVLLAIPPVQQTASQAASTILEVICASRAPIPLCEFPRPLNEVAVIHIAGYLAFIVSSLAFFGWIVFGSYRKPGNYDRRRTSPFGVWGIAAFWVLLLLGGQIFFALGSPLRFWALPFSLFSLVVGLISARLICLRVRFREAAGSTRDRIDQA